jgi:glucans biosynthesis protein
MKTHLVFALMTVTLLVLVITRTERRNVTFDTVASMARALSAEKYVAPVEPPPALRKLGYDQDRDIRLKDDATLWRREGLPFQVRMYFTAGEHASQPVTIYQANRNGAGQVRFSPDKFTFGPLVKLDPEDQARGGFSGFRIYYPLNKPGQLDEVVSFRGASYFRPLAKDQIYGVSARGLAIHTLGEESFPSFTDFWLVEPSPNATEVTLYALLDCPDATGAYEFRIAPGDETKIRVRVRLFPRRNVKDAGLAPLTSMFWYGENTSNTFGNWRPEVHDSDGLQVARADGEWLWRPLAWSRQRQVNTFADTNPKGFGLFQRDRDFTHYQDLETKYHQRPSLWVQPEGDWGAGEVVLVQNNTGDEFQDNIVAYWRPKDGLRAGQPLELAYTLVTFTRNDGLPPLARCVWTRIDYQNEKYFRQIFLDFDGGELANLPPDAKVQPDIWIGKNGRLSEDIHCTRIPQTNTWRVNFTASTAQTNQPIEMTCRLKRDGKVISETWNYTWVK